jgi:hypothetical protein
VLNSIVFIKLGGMKNAFPGGLAMSDELGLKWPEYKSYYTLKELCLVPENIKWQFFY